MGSTLLNFANGYSKYVKSDHKDWSLVLCIEIFSSGSSLLLLLYSFDFIQTENLLHRLHSSEGE